MIDHAEYDALVQSAIESQAHEIRVPVEFVMELVREAQQLRAHAVGWIEAVERIDPALATIMRDALEQCRGLNMTTLKIDLLDERKP